MSITKATMKLEVVFLPVSDANRSIEFFSKMGWNVDHDHQVHESLRFVQMTPPGSACSFAFGQGLTENASGSVDNVMLVVDDTPALVGQLRAVGIEATDPDEQAWGTFTSVTDPDGNIFSFQQLPDHSSATY